jgi:peroxiredoxin
MLTYPYKRTLLSIFFIFVLSACSKNNPVSGLNQSDGYIPQYGKALVGKKAENFSLNTLADTKLSLSDYKGQVVLINFWATWCPPCRHEIPGFVDVYADQNAKGFNVIGIAIDQKELVKDFVDEFKIPYPIVYGSGDANAVALQYGNSIGALPFNVIVDKEQIIRYAEPGELSKERLEKLIQLYL